jgi:hypothetical protein
LNTIQIQEDFENQIGNDLEQHKRQVALLVEKIKKVLFDPSLDGCNSLIVLDALIQCLAVSAAIGAKNVTAEERDKMTVDIYQSCILLIHSSHPRNTIPVV